jgi:hypothetical protein
MAFYSRRGLTETGRRRQSTKGIRCICRVSLGTKLQGLSTRGLVTSSKSLKPTEMFRVLSERDEIFAGMRSHWDDILIPMGLLSEWVPFRKPVRYLPVDIGTGDNPFCSSANSLRIMDLCRSPEAPIVAP